MPNKNIKKCSYSHCKHQDKIIDIDVDDYEIENTRYLHTDCKHEKDTRAAIIDYWYKNIDEDVIFNQLVRIIDRLIYKESVDADYLLWALKKRSKYLKHPPGIVYVAKDKELKKNYEYQKKLKEYNENKNKIDIAIDHEPTFTYQDNGTKKKFGDIFGGM